MNRPSSDQAIPIADTVFNAHGLAVQAIQLALAKEDFKQAATEIATLVGQGFHCSYAAIGMLQGASIELAALSGMADVRGEFELPRKLTAAMNEAVDQFATLRYPAASNDSPGITLMHRELTNSVLGGTFLTIPLPCRQQAIGAMTLMRESRRAWSDQEKSAAEQVACLLGPVLLLKQQADESLLARLCRTPGDIWEAVSHPGATQLKLWLAGAVLMCAGLCLIPVQDEVTARARLEGVVQRSIAAPVDSYIQDVLVRPGFQVKAGQPLLTLADQDLRLEQSRLEAELGRYRSNQADAFAQQDRSGMVASQAHIDEISAQLTLLREQIARTRITAPFAGVVIRGDQQQLAGAPVKRGDVLMILSPNTDFRLILQVNEHDIARLKDGQPGRVAFSALPDSVFAMKLARITPVSNIVDGDNTFEVEAALDRSHSTLRPGLEGIAHIALGQRPLAFIWGKRVVDWLNFKLWVLLG